MSQEEPTLLVITSTERKSGMRGPEDSVRKVAETGISVEALQKSFGRFLDSLQQIFVEVDQGRVGDFLLEEVTFTAEIGADGAFKLVGTGVGVSASSGVTFTLRRQATGAGGRPEA
jgi:hypothetical protein